MTIYRVTHRYKNGSKPWQVSDHTVGYYSTIEKARDTVKNFLGENATLDNDFGFDSLASPNHSHTEYLIDLIKVW